MTHGDFLERRKRLSDLANGYRASAVLFTANELGLFKVLSNGAKGLKELAIELDVSEHGLLLLLHALVGLDLLAMDKDTFALYGDAEEFLRSDSPYFFGDMMQHGYRLYQRWESLGEAVKLGATPFSKEVRAGRTKEDWRAFIMAMDNNSRTSAVQTADALDLTGVKRILDLGGGPGTFLYTFLERLPDATGAILDFDHVLEIAQEVVQRFTVGERVSYIPGDMFNADYQGPYDLIFLGNIIHSSGPERCRGLVRRCTDALEEGGRLVIKDFFMDETATRPADGAMFALNMLVGTDNGQSYRWKDAVDWMEEQGLTIVQKIPVAFHSGILVGKKLSL